MANLSMKNILVGLIAMTTIAGSTCYSKDVSTKAAGEKAVPTSRGGNVASTGDASMIERTRELVKATTKPEVAKNFTKCEKNDAIACFLVGDAFLSAHGVKQDHILGIYWEEKAAKLGLPVAQYNLSNFYLEGKHVEKNVQTGLYWERLAAENGHKEALYQMGVRYCAGDQVKEDCSAGIRYLRRAAKKGYVPAKTSLGLAYSRGQGVPKNYDLAKRYLNEADRLGDPDATCWLGYMYSRGIGFEKDSEKGSNLIRRSEANGSNVCTKEILQNK